MQLSKSNIPFIQSERIIKPKEDIFSLPEKVLQFGTGVLLRGLPDYFIDKANRNSIFNGRIVVIKSTTEGDSDAFTNQDGLYTVCIRGLQNGTKVEENIICSAISRVLSAQTHWQEILQSATQPTIKIIISNTTEVGIRLLKESIFQQPPVSFPGKLLAVLYERYVKYAGSPDAGMIIIPTELITDNGKLLHSILVELAQFNNLKPAFMDWLSTHNHFCNSLVDCIVPGKPEEKMLQQVEKEIGYTDRLIFISEVYRLWAIEAGESVRSQLSFANGPNEIVVTNDISIYKELKLRLLNGTHSLCCGLAFLAGLPTVKDAMESKVFFGFVQNLMLKEIALSIPYPLPISEAKEFAQKVLDRFSNPFVQHKWISITLQYSSKMRQRVLPLIFRFYELYKTAPAYISLGFAGYLLFMRPTKKEGDKYLGEWQGQTYPINDEKAAYFFEIWQAEARENIILKILQNSSLWGSDLSALNGFAELVSTYIEIILKQDVTQALKMADKNISQ